MPGPDIKQRLRLNADIQANSCNDQLDSRICADALAEIERLEKALADGGTAAREEISQLCRKVQAERDARARDRREYEGARAAMRAQLDTIADAALRAGIKEALGG